MNQTTCGFKDCHFLETWKVVEVNDDDEWQMNFISQYDVEFSVTTEELKIESVPMAPLEYINYALQRGSKLVSVEKI